MALVPDSLTSVAYQPWGPGNPPEPQGTEKAHVFVLDDQGNVWHRWFDGTKLQNWENWGRP